MRSRSIFSRLSNLFNALPRNSSLRLSVYKTILQIAVADDSINILHLSRSDVEKWTNEWDISPEDKSAFLENIVDAYAKSNQLCVKRDLASFCSNPDDHRYFLLSTVSSPMTTPSSTFAFYLLHLRPQETHLSKSLLLHSAFPPSLTLTPFSKLTQS